ncbi:pentapeptide repeat-containing protein [Streptomyces atratus]|uniref:pentapeptide repeat-containing protein n=1 Tax=Streptomyces atratus TaxID=1893 RepID=UPI00339845DF
MSATDSGDFQGRPRVPPSTCGAPTGILRRGHLASLRLQQLRFTRCTFRRADLRQATLDGCRFKLCDLRTANLSGASLRGVCLAGCDLSGADLRGRAERRAIGPGPHRHPAYRSDQCHWHQVGQCHPLRDRA